ncbi:hypothetical protein A7982_13951 [Minicystis rosea]|nr:hypothetical protein A7982_13951 [Minicystis rosea]
MLIILSEQMEAFAQDACQQLERRVREHLGRRWGERCAP